MRPILFVGDVVRFARSGQLLTLCGLLFGRIEVLVIFAAVAIAFMFYDTSREKALLVFLGVAIAVPLFMMYTLQFLTPLYFGTFAIGRLRTKATPAAYVGSIYDQFILVPCGQEVYATYYGKRPAAGAVGQSYVLLRHPVDPETALAVIDDDPRYVNRILQCVSQQRGAEIVEQLKALRRSTNADFQPDQDRQ
jgi:hypothetical protein